MRKRSASGLALATVVMLGGCAQVLGIEDLPLVDGGTRDDAQSFFSVRGMAAGVIDPVSIRLEYTGGSELLSITEDGPFAFANELPDGASYTVVFVGEPPCDMDGAVGVVRGSDPAIGLACEGVYLSGLAISGPAAPAFEVAPTRTSYEADVSLLQQTMRITATAVNPQASITVAGVPVTSGAASEPLVLSLGDNNIDVVVTGAGGGARTYSLTVRRAVEIAQYAYGKASNTGAADNFGYNLALSGDTLAVGAYREDGLAEDSGAVYVFRRTGATWQQEAYLKASNTGAGDNFGISVSLSDDTLAVGARYEDGAAQDSGAVYVFRRTDGAWQQEAYLKASNSGAEDNFGWRVSLAGVTLAVGAIYEDSAAQGVGGNQGNNSAADSGAVYMFRRTDGTWQQEAYLKASNTGAGDNFGISVSLSDDTLAVGARYEDSAGGSQDDNSVANSGAVYVFRHTDGAWQQEAYLKASNAGAGDLLGWSIALSGNALAVGAYLEDSAAQGMGGNQDDDSADNSGAVYVFRRKDGAWQQEAYLKASNAGKDDEFGISVALAGDTLAVGARHEASAAQRIGGNQDDDSAAKSGAVYVFRDVGGAWQQEAYFKASNTGAGDRFGTIVALSDDTLAIGAPLEDSAAQGVGGNQDSNSASDSGAVYVFH